MDFFSLPDFDHHESVVFGSDEVTGLRCIIGLHNTTLGPALGGTRFWSYASSEEAATDVLRLSKGMTYKAAITGLPLGGGKGVIIGDARKIKTADLMRAYGRIVEGLGGRYITAEDVGTTVEDMDAIRLETEHVRGKSTGTGDPSPVTAYGVFMGLKAAVEHKLGTSDLSGVRVAVQGLGHVGYHLCNYLHEAGASLVVSDITKASLARVVSDFGATALAPETIVSADVDVFAPCALGAVLDDHSLETIKARVIAGAANNQLAESRHGDALRQLGILYAPDYALNAGGLINVWSEGEDISQCEVMREIEGIHRTMGTIFRRAERENCATNLIADRMAEERFKHPPTDHRTAA